jgi:uncharacterized protein YbjQ (UPF0145 family)
MLYIVNLNLICSSMINPKEVLVVTTSNLQNINIHKYIKPVSAHVVAGTNVFSDLAASFTDFFGGRSTTYQKQLNSLYNEAIDRIKVAAFELGANCVVGLSIDMDEISGKGKAMFMLTAVGTAVVIEDNKEKNTQLNPTERFENVSADKIRDLYKKKQVIKKAEEGGLVFDDELWEYITTNQTEEVFPFILNKYRNNITQYQVPTDETKQFFDKTSAFLDAFAEPKRTELLYNAILNEENERVAIQLINMVSELQLFDVNYVNQLIKHPEFAKQKRGLQILMYDKDFYNKEDIASFENIKNYIQDNFKERGTRSTKKQMLSSKEKEIWSCECGKSNDVGGDGNYCEGCGKDIFGFKNTEVSPPKVISYIDRKVSLIAELIA